MSSALWDACRRYKKKKKKKEKEKKKEKQKMVSNSNRARKPLNFYLYPISFCQSCAWFYLH